MTNPTRDPYAKAMTFFPAPSCLMTAHLPGDALEAARAVSAFLAVALAEYGDKIQMNPREAYGAQKVYEFLQDLLTIAAEEMEVQEHKAGETITTGQSAS